MGITSLSVTLDPALPVYFPGQTVQGVVRIELDSITSIKRLAVTCQGCASVLWDDDVHEKILSVSEEYFKKEEELWSGEGVGGQMHEGVFDYPVRFNLPINIPSSFEAPCGKVTYSITASVERKLRFNKTSSLTFPVCNVYDLNLNSNSKKPCCVDKNDGSVLCCSSGPVSVTLYSYRSGFVPGETMLLNGEVLNKGKNKIKSTHAKIIEVVTYTAGTDRHLTEREVVSVTRSGLDGGRSCFWTNVPLTIPSVVPSELAYCSIMEVSYFLRFTAKFELFGGSLSEQRPIVIGSVPLVQDPLVPQQQRRETSLPSSSFHKYDLPEGGDNNDGDELSGTVFPIRGIGDNPASEIYYAPSVFTKGLGGPDCAPTYVIFTDAH